MDGQHGAYFAFRSSRRYGNVLLAVPDLRISIAATLRGALSFNRLTGAKSRKLTLVMRGRITRWSQLFVEFALNQGLVQSAGMVSGLIYVRLLPVDQYALYALSLTALSFAAIGSDMGLTESLSYFWRKSRQDPSVL